MLKNIEVIIFILALRAFFAPFCGAQATIVGVRLHRGGTRSFKIAEYGKFFFQNDHLFIKEGLNLPYSIPASPIQKMAFAHIAGIQFHNGNSSLPAATTTVQ